MLRHFHHYINSFTDVLSIGREKICILIFSKENVFPLFEHAQKHSPYYLNNRQVISKEIKPSLGKEPSFRWVYLHKEEVLIGS